MAISNAHEIPAVRDRSTAEPLETPLLLAGGLVCVASVAVAAAQASSDAAFGRGLLQLLIVAVPIAVGVYALRAPINKSFGFAALATGFAWSLTALAESPSSVPHTVGRLATWLTFPCVVYLLLAFPHGRLEKGLDRTVFVGVVGVMLFFFYGTAPLVEAFPPKTLWSTCTTDCPANALFVLDEQPAFLTNLVYVREWLVEVLWVGLFASMFRRWRAASPLQRKALGPAFVAGTLLGASHYAHITARQLGAPADEVIALSSVWTFGIVAVCAAFLLGLVRRRMLLAGALARLGASLRAGESRAHMRDALATAIGDPTTQLLFRAPDSGDWTDARGRPVESPKEPDPSRAVTTVGGGRDEVAIVHDVALLDDRELLDGVSGIVAAGWRHAQLANELAKAVDDLDESRRGIAEAVDLERVRIERDLHDGAQQRLVTLRIRLGLAAERLATDPGAAVNEVHELGFEAERVLDELRSLAHGAYPPVLVERGLPDALRSVGANASMPVRLVANGVTRLPIELESAVYFTCVEAMQNAVKHADGATSVSITLDQTRGSLRFEVRDDGPGFTQAQSGHGLRNMRDRIEGIGGDFTLESEPGRGTRVAGSAPVSAAKAP